MLKSSFTLAACLSVLVLTGCTSPQINATGNLISNAITAAAKDPAAVNFVLATVSGTLTYNRAMTGGTNNLTVGGAAGITTK